MYETAFLDVGTRLDLYQKLLVDEPSWSGYMLHSSADEEHFSTNHSFSISVKGEPGFIVQVGSLT
jgi:hypothetical protein